jgi:hypothetical protein
MSSLLPAKIERVWLVDTRGTAVEKRPPPKKLSSGQRHYLYRLGLQALDRFLKSRGFRSNISDSTTRLSYEKHNVLIDVAVRRPDNIAYVTSYPGYTGSEDVVGETADGQKMYRVKAKVTTAKDILGSEFVAQVMISDQFGTRRPIFVPLPKDLENPARYVIENVLGILAAACREIPSLRDAFSEDAVRAAQERPIEDALDDQAIPLLPN